MAVASPAFILPMHVLIRCSPVALSAALSLLLPSPATGQAQTTHNLILAATVRSRTSLRVSTSELRFDVVDGMPSPTVLVDFTAAARARTDGDVVLTVQPLGPVRTVSGSTPPDLVVSFEADGLQRTLAAQGPQAVGTWKGSGIHAGRVWFTLGGGAVAGSYVVPVRFVLSVL